MMPSMPELPDLVYIEERLQGILLDREIQAVRVFEPVVLRVMVAGGFEAGLAARRCARIRRRGPFLAMAFLGGNR